MPAPISFPAKLAAYKKQIDTDIAQYATSMRKSIYDQYGAYVGEVETDVFLDMLARGGKRFRGALVMVGYDMCGGKDTAMIIQAARAIEMLHAYILIVDDIQDRSALRRGKPTAHEMIAAYHKQHKLRGGAEHTGVSLALMAGIAGGHIAQTILANLPVDAELKIKVVSVVNRTMAITAHGQTLDIMNELVDRPDLADIDRVLEWKSGLYSVTNPLHVGMVLAGADCAATDAITPYSLHAGKAFQITDDILGVFGNEAELGKRPIDDIREGKGTILSVYALAHAAPEGRAFLRQCLGNPNLTQKDFNHCKTIIEQSGALAHARTLAADHAAAALVALSAGQSHWSAAGSAFLAELAHFLQDRAS